jgi:hypothetical protein
MDPAERRSLLCTLLAEENDEGRARIAEREAARENDPGLEQDFLLAEREHDAAISHIVISHEGWAERVRSSPVRQKDVGATLLYRTHQNVQALVPRSNAMPSSADPSPANDGELDGYSKAIAEFTVAYVAKTLVERDRKIAELQGELREIKGMLGATLQLLGQQKSKLWKPGDA